MLAEWCCLGAFSHLRGQEVLHLCYEPEAVAWNLILPSLSLSSAASLPTPGGPWLCPKACPDQCHTTRSEPALQEGPSAPWRKPTARTGSPR